MRKTNLEKNVLLPARTFSAASSAWEARPAAPRPEAIADMSIAGGFLAPQSGQACVPHAERGNEDDLALGSCSLDFFGNPVVKLPSSAS